MIAPRQGTVAAPMPPAETEPQVAGARWLVPALQMWPLAARRCLVRNPLNGTSMELSSGEYAVISACDGCRPLNEHEARAAAQLSAPEVHRPAFRELLQRCAQRGLLISLPELVARFGASSDTPPAAIGGIAVRTADRPKLLARLLASAVALEARNETRRRWVVFDDSRDPLHEEANRAAIEACGALDVVHVGRAAATAVEHELRTTFPHAKREIAWLLGAGPVAEATYGRPLNHALLRFAGSAFITVDDDVVLDARQPALVEPGFAVTDDNDELLWYDAEEPLWHDCPALALDPIAAHARWLGLPMAAAWVQAEQHAGALAEIHFSAARADRFAPDARVLFTHNHACGDPGSSILPLQLLTLPRRSRQWLSANPRAAASAFAHRVNWRGQTRLRLAPRRVLTFTTMAGIDNSRLMPPVPRSHRSEDVLLGIAAQWMYPSAWLVDLPFGMPHLRESPKQWLPNTANFMQEPLHVLYGLLDEHAALTVAESPERRLAAAAALLLDVAAMSDEQLIDALVQHATDAGSRTLFAIAAQLDDETLPAQWKAQLVPWLKSPALAVDSDSVRARVLAPATVRTLAEDYGNAMQPWPQLWQFCRERFQ